MIAPVSPSGLRYWMIKTNPRPLRSLLLLGNNTQNTEALNLPTGVAKQVI
jgi:hypothetical protein